MLSENTGTVAITGSSGFIGSELAGLLRSEGLRVLGISRNPRAGELGWDPYAGRIDVAQLAGVDTVIHLAGAGVAEQRWTPERKTEIRRSRVEVTQFLSRALADLDPPPKTLLSGSAIGFYGSRGDEQLTESSPPGEGYFADLCRDWEAATAPAQAAGIRVAHLRTGIVLGEGGGALKKMLPPFKMGVGGRFGGGKQWMSWIALPDMLRAITFLMEHTQIAGPVNLVGPNPVTNAEFTRALNHALHRPGFLPVPEAAIRALFGEMGEATLLGSQRVLPARLQAAGFQFRHGVLAEALPGLLRR